MNNILPQDETQCIINLLHEKENYSQEAVAIELETRNTQKNSIHETKLHRDISITQVGTSENKS